MTDHILHIIQFGSSTKNTYHITTELGHKITLSPQKNPKSFNLWAKPEKPNKTLL